MEGLSHWCHQSWNVFLNRIKVIDQNHSLGENPKEHFFQKKKKEKREKKKRKKKEKRERENNKIKWKLQMGGSNFSKNMKGH
mgnify:CR=1 FL=1